MPETDDSSLQAQIATFQQQSAGKMSPEQRERMAARRAQLVQTGIADQSLKVGEVAPDFTLPDAYSNPVVLSELLTQGPVVLTFYRGDWCPYCNLTLRAYQKVLPEIEKLHATLVAVSPQTPDNTLLTVQHKDLTYPVLSDLGNRVAHQFRLVWSIPEDQRTTSANLPQHNGDASWELPVPGTFVISPDRIVQLAWVNADWTERLEPSVIIETLQQLVKTN
ncbi:MAG: peroxiredoxin-like family protein [Chloroflexota bacterium]